MTRITVRARSRAAALLVAGACIIPAGVDAQAPACGDDPPSGLDAFVGTYVAGGPASDDVVTFAARRGTLLMHPALWNGPMVLTRATADSFVVATHPRFAAAFERDANGCANGARIYGLSDVTAYTRADVATPRPVQLLLSGRPREAARRYRALDPSGTDRVLGVGRRFLQSFPTRTDDAAAFLSELARLLPDDADVQTAHGHALVFAGDREGAKAAYARALSLDPSHDEAASSLARLEGRSGSAEGGWRLPFDLADLFAPPRPAEIDTVWARWQRRELDPDEPRIVMRRPVDLDGVAAEVRVVSHRVHGARHLGVVLVPDGAETGALPVLVEAKGVSPSFFPLVVPGGLTSPDILGDARDRVVYVAPGYRGERIVLGADTLVSEGDRSDAWDGATDDLIAFLRVALELTPEADRSRVCVFGRSRGGTVALLSGLREPRIGCVVAWAAPTDWFVHMGQLGWTQRELVAEGLRSQAVPGQTGGQFINYFLSGALDGRRGLEDTRLHMIASSPLYFAPRLPLAQVHWGLEDAMVPSANGEAFVARYRADREDERCLDVRLHPDAGHDQDRQLAPLFSRNFLLRAFGGGAGRMAECRP